MAVALYPKFLISPHFFQYLKEIGRAATESWLKENWKNIGKESTLDIHDKFLKRSWVKKQEVKA